MTRHSFKTSAEWEDFETQPTGNIRYIINRDGFINIEIEASITSHHRATRHQPEEGGDIEDFEIYLITDKERIQLKEDLFDPDVVERWEERIFEVAAENGDDEYHGRGDWEYDRMRDRQMEEELERS